MDILVAFIIGLFISLGFGYLVTSNCDEYFMHKIEVEFPNKNDRNGIPEPDERAKGFDVRIIGTLERLFFTLLVGFSISGVGGMMIAWITVKMYIKNELPLKSVGGRAFSTRTLLLNLISMLFALIGGLFIKMALK